MSAPQPSANLVRAAPTTVAFVTRTGDDAPAGHSGRAAAVPGYSPAVDHAEGADQPCSIKGLTGGLAAGVLGFVFGFVPSMFRHRSLRERHVWTAEGWASAKAFAVMSGIYTTVQCLCERIRQQDDGINRIIAGGASGVAVAWRSGWVGALQSGALLAIFSWLFDFGTTSPAKAAGLASSRPASGCGAGSSGCGVSVGRWVSASHGAAAHGPRRALHLQFGSGAGGFQGAGPLGLPTPQQVLNTPAVMWMGNIVNRQYFSQPRVSLSQGA